jgi:hypothetical protein
MMILCPLHCLHNPEKEYNNYPMKTTGSVVKTQIQTFSQKFPYAG